MGRRGAVVHLDRERRLRYSMAAVEELQERYDVDLIAGEEIRFTDTSEVCWVVCLGLQHAGEEAPLPESRWERLLIRLGLRDRPQITPEMVKDWVDMENVVEVTQALGAALSGDVGSGGGQMAEDPTTAGTTAPSERKLSA